MTERLTVTRVCRVKSLHHSALNNLHWLVVLDCNHEIWVTRKARPTAKRMNCPECVKLALKSLR